MTGGSTGQHAVFCGNGDTWAPKAHGPASLPWMAEVSIVSPLRLGYIHKLRPHIFACTRDHLRLQMEPRNAARWAVLRRLGAIAFGALPGFAGSSAEMVECPRLHHASRAQHPLNHYFPLDVGVHHVLRSSGDDVAQWI